MSGFIIKLIACASMLCDHASYALFGRPTLLNVFGRLAFPLYAFLIAQGCAHTKDIRKYALRLLIFGVVSQHPFMLLLSMGNFGDELRLNVFFTLFLGVACIYIYEEMRKLKLPTILAALPALAVSILGNVANTDYGTWGVLLIFWLYIARESKLFTAGILVALSVWKYSDVFVPLVTDGLSAVSSERLWMAAAFYVALAIMLLYNGKRGKNVKYVMYAFYPGHLVLLHVINVLFVR